VKTFDRDPGFVIPPARVAETCRVRAKSARMMLRRHGIRKRILRVRLADGEGGGARRRGGITRCTNRRDPAFPFARPMPTSARLDDTTNLERNVS